MHNFKWNLTTFVLYVLSISNCKQYTLLGIKFMWIDVFDAFQIANFIIKWKRKRMRFLCETHFTLMGWIMFAYLEFMYWMLRGEQWKSGTHFNKIELNRLHEFRHIFLYNWMQSLSILKSNGSKTLTKTQWRAVLVVLVAFNLFLFRYVPFLMVSFSFYSHSSIGCL